MRRLVHSTLFIVPRNETTTKYRRMPTMKLHILYHCHFRKIRNLINEYATKMSALLVRFRPGLARGRRNRLDRTKHVLDRLWLGYHRGGVSGRNQQKGSFWQGTCQPSRHRCRPHERVISSSVNPTDVVFNLHKFLTCYSHETEIYNDIYWFNCNVHFPFLPTAKRYRSIKTKILHLENKFYSQVARSLKGEMS